MGQGTNGVSVGTNGVGTHGHRKEVVPDPDKLEQRVAMIREHMGDVVAELDHRRHELTDVKVQLKKNGPVLAGIGGGVLLLAGGAIGYSVYQSKKRAEIRRAYERSVKQKQYESVFHRVLTAAAGAFFGVLVKSLATRLMKPVIEAPVTSPPPLPDY